MKYVTLIILLAGCASSPPEAKQWSAKLLEDKPTKIFAEVNDTGNKLACTVNYNYGLLDSIESPRKSKYDTAGTVALINEIGCSRVITMGPGPSDLAAAIGSKSDTAFMLKRGVGPGTVGEFAMVLKKAIAGQNLPKPLIGLSISMGASNLMTLAIHDPSLFSKIVLMNPMILRPNQWSNKLLDFSRPLGEIDPALMPGNHFTKEEWATNNLFAQVEHATELPPIFITACKTDKFQLFKPTEEFVALLKVKGFDVTWMPVDNCSHTNPSMDGIAEWIGK